MLFIYKPTANKIIRTILKPFSPFIPVKYRFPINGSFDIEIEDGKSINLTCNPTSYLSRLLFWGGVKGFEYHSIRVFKELVKKSNFMLDIGANIGYYSLVAAKLNPNIKIIGFEPMPAANKYFKINIKQNGFTNIVVEEIALSNETGNTKFYAVKSKKFLELEDHLNGDGTINSENTTEANLEQYDVQTERLDNYKMIHKLPKVDIIKLDTEASEHLVMSASSKVLSEDRPIILCEVIPNKIEMELENIFLKHDYVFYKAYPNGLRKQNTLVGNYDHIIDYFIVHNSKIDLLQNFIIN